MGKMSLPNNSYLIVVVDDIKMKGKKTFLMLFLAPGPEPNCLLSGKEILFHEGLCLDSDLDE